LIRQVLEEILYRYGHQYSQQNNFKMMLCSRFVSFCESMSPWTNEREKHSVSFI